jgi:hypothetical protein
MLCGIKAGDALKVIKVSKNFLSGEDGDEDMVNIQSCSPFMSLFAAFFIYLSCFNGCFYIFRLLYYNPNQNPNLNLNPHPNPN